MGALAVLFMVCVASASFSSLGLSFLVYEVETVIVLLSSVTEESHEYNLPGT